MTAPRQEPTPELAVQIRCGRALESAFALRGELVGEKREQERPTSVEDGQGKGRLRAFPKRIVDGQVVTPQTEAAEV